MHVPTHKRNPISPVTLKLSAIAFFVCILFSGRVEAYNVCLDPNNPCTHEFMTSRGMDLYFYQQGVTPPTHISNYFVYPHSTWQNLSGVALEIKNFSDDILNGVEAPDERDYIYDNDGLADNPLDDAAGALSFMNHFWSPDDSIGEPMVFDPIGIGLDDYPNAFNSAQALWTRALGFYAAGNKEEAYRHLGMVAHFLGDMSVPTHAHNDMHGPDIVMDDAFEEWMSGTGESYQRQPPLSFPEHAQLVVDGPLTPPSNLDADRQLLWLFLNTNQIAAVFASDDTDGNEFTPFDPKFPWIFTEDYVDSAITNLVNACASEPSPGCPKLASRLAETTH